MYPGEEDIQPVRVTASTFLYANRQWQRKQTDQKKIISWVVGLPAAIITNSLSQQTCAWWVQFAAIAVLAVMFANGVFGRNYQIKSRKEIWR